ncbi:hypothetical protein V5740_06090 [Croceibacterium sp. TMG7-5b_MA50]|uniref:hypothetical protein n=1 Tax=Croceibacterium sp. TMG7-5b_MA50 TaxID=3121290 RepID=UPI003221E18E
MTYLTRSLVLGCSLLALSACGPDEIASPGTGGNIIINPPATPAPSPAPSPAPTPPATVTPAGGCPTIADPQGLADEGTIAGPTGTYRVCTLPSRFNASSRLPYFAGVLYRMNGRVDVGTDGGPVPDASDGSSDTNVVLTIDPGVIVYSSGAAFLNVNRGNRINAVGTAERPIIFTSRDNVVGFNTESSSGQWGGVVLSGRAPVTDCAASGAVPGSAQCERQVEGSASPAFFGGATVNDNSGRMSYVQIRYSGFVLGSNSELQSLTTGGTGTGTQLDHIMSYNSSDDGAEFFGGYVNMKYFIVVGAEDDSIDSDTGVKANLQYVIVVHNTNTHDTIIEADSDDLRDSTPRQNTRISNFVFVQGAAAADGQAAIRLRGGTDYALLNGVLVSPQDECIRVQHSETIRNSDSGLDDVGPPIFQSVVMQCGGAAQFIGSNNVTADNVRTIFNAGTNNNASFTPTLTNLFVNGANESAVSAFNASTLSSFFDATTYIGAVRDASDTWYARWTCNSATANFGTGNTGACTSLPVYQ